MMKTNKKSFQNYPHLFGLTEDHLAKGESPLLSISTFKAFHGLKAEAKLKGIDLQVLSGFRSFESQKSIWNLKAKGERDVLDDNSCPKSIDECSEEEWVFSILRWSAFPGLSRHHWGTDFDIFDANFLNDHPDYKVQLIPSEYEGKGPFSALGAYLEHNLKSSDFFRPYEKDLGGIAREPWHISFRPEAEKNFEELSFDLFWEFLNSSFCEDIQLINTVKDHAEEIFQRYALTISS